MIHLAVPAHNTRRKETARCIGLGDRIIPVRVAHAHARALGQPVTLHLTAIMAGGVDRYDEKLRARLRSWEDILGLFPPGHVTLRTHAASMGDSRAWVEWLRRSGIVAESWHYGDTLGLLAEDYAIGLDVSRYLRASPLLDPPTEAPGLTLPDGPFVTMQPSGSIEANRLAPEQSAALIERWQSRGYAVVVVGHEAANPILRTSLRHVAYAQARADMHVGADSGPMHLAALFKPYDRLHLISPGRVSRSRVLWLANGAHEEPRP